MQPEQIIGQLLGSLVGRKRKRRSGMLGMAMGRRGRGSLLTGGTLLTAAGLVWGALESMQKSTVSNAGGGGGVPPPVPTGGSAPPRTMTGQATPVVPPPLPGAATGPAATAAATPSPPPPLPAQPGQPAPARAPSGGDVAPLLPLLQLAISAARADGELSAEEATIIRERAAELGVTAEVERALGERPPLESLTAAFTTDEQRQAAYALAYSVVHGDGVLAPGERMYLTQLGRLLRLRPDDIDTIERETLGEE